MTPDLPRPDQAPARGPGVRASAARILKSLLPIGILALLFLVDFPLCPMKHLVGVPCPGCGLTRATGALASGDLALAMAMHPLVLLILPLVLWLVVRSTLVSARLLRSDSFDPLRRVPSWVWAACIVLLLGVWVARLAGALGGHPDPVDPAGGLIARALAAIGGLR